MGCQRFLHNHPGRVGGGAGLLAGRLRPLAFLLTCAGAQLHSALHLEVRLAGRTLVRRD